MSPPKARRFDLFLTCPPGLEPVLLEEVRSLGWTAARAQAGGVAMTGAWHDVWRANLLVRGAGRVLLRLGSFRAPSLNVLHGKAKELPFAEVLGTGQAFRIEAFSRKSRIFHTGAAEERVGKAVMAATGAEWSDEGLKIMVRIESDEATISADTSGELLHKRGFKRDVAGAPLRETMASLFLRACGYNGEEPLLDPMCGSGTIPIEAAEIAAGLAPGRERRFAFEDFPAFLPDAYRRARAKALGTTRTPDVVIRGADRSEGAIAAAGANAERAGVASFTSFAAAEISRLERPEGRPGLVLVNPPYGARLGEAEALQALYAAFGRVMRERFQGWRVGLVTSDERLARATGLRWSNVGPPVPHGPLKIKLHRTEPVP